MSQRIVTEPPLIVALRTQLELRLVQVRGRRQEKARMAMAALPAFAALMTDPATVRAVELYIEILGALPKGKPRGRPRAANYFPAIAGKRSKPTVDTLAG
jgi:hypothetical protein